MASVKISVNELAAQKAAYINAAKNVRDVLVTVKNARSSVGNDKMLASARENLGKIAERLEKRAEALERLAKLIDNATSTYKSAQKRSVAVVSDLKANKTDFYGNPVHVSTAAGGAAAAAAAAGAKTVNITQNYYTTNVTSPASGQSAPVSHSSGADAPVSPSVGNSYPSDAVTIGSADPEVLNTAPETGSDAFGEARKAVFHTETRDDIPAAEAVTTESTRSVGAAESIPFSRATEVEMPGEDGLNGALGAGLFGAGAVLGAAGVGVAEHISDKHKENAQKRKIDKQLSEARRKMDEIESEEARIKASLAENGEKA